MPPDQGKAGNMSMNSSRPYLLRAIYEWINDNGLTPHVLVDAAVSGTRVPLTFVQDGRIVLNISSSAAHDMVLGNELVTFVARFSGKATEIRIPVNAILAIYARENGKGMVFQDEDIDETHASLPAETPKKAVLTVIK